MPHTEEKMAFVRTRSHRARDRLKFLLGGWPQYYWTWDTGGVFAEIPQEELADARKIPGVTLARVAQAELRQCWKASDYIRNEGQ